MRIRTAQTYSWLLGPTLLLLLAGTFWWWHGALLLPTPEGSSETDATTAANSTEQILQPRQRLGAGRGTQVTIGTEGTFAAVATDVGLYLYETASFARRHLWTTETPVQNVAIASTEAAADATPDVTAIAFSTMVTDQKLLRWESQTDALTAIDLDESLVHGLWYSPDGAYLVGISFYRLFIWDAATLDLLTSYQQPSALTKHVSFSPDGQRLAVVYKETLELWQLRDQTLLQTVQLEEEHYFNSATVTFAPGGHQIAVADLREPLLYRWDVADGPADDGTYLVPESTLQLNTNAGAITDLHFAPDGARLAVGATSGQLYLYDLTTADPTVTVLPMAGLHRLAWTSDGTMLAAAVAEGLIQIVPLADGAPPQMLQLPTYAATTKVAQLDFTTEHTLMAVLTTGAIYHWQLSDSTLMASLEAHSQGRLNSVTFTDDSTRLAVGAEHGVVQVWDVAQGTPVTTIHPPTGRVDAVVPAPDGRFAIAASDALALGVWADPVYLWDAVAEEPVETGPFTLFDTDDTGFVTTCGVYWNNAVFSADGQHLVTTAYAHKALLWRVADGMLLQQFEGHTSAILDIALSPDGTLLATASDDEEVRIWQTADGQLSRRLAGHAGGAVAVAFAPDGQSLATRSVIGDIRLWPLAGGEPTHLLADVRNPRSNLVFSPDGTWLATGARGNRAYLWRVTQQGTEPPQVYRLEGHNGIVNDVAFSPDGAQLATAADDGTIDLWAVPSH